jgi:hypothetical protein
MRRAFALVAVFTLGCGQTSANADSTTDAPTTFACEICAKPGLSCFAPNVESVTIVIDRQTSTGCAGHIETRPASEYEIDCEHGQLCTNGTCQPATITEGSMTWSTATCHAP